MKAINSITGNRGTQLRAHLVDKKKKIIYTNKKFHINNQKTSVNLFYEQMKLSNS